MFRLDHEISKWCSALTRQGHFSASQVEELKDHLHSEIQAQLASGASEEDAFRLAVARLGTVDELAQEYSKNRRIGHALGTLANAPSAARILGLYLIAIACLMSYATAAAWIAYFSGRFTPPDTVPLMLAIAVIVVFGWCGLQGLRLMRGRALSFGALCGLLALVLIQVPIIGGMPANGYELSAGLQYAVLFGPAEYRFEFHPGADLHINSAFSEAYFGLNIVALAAGIFIGLKLFDRWRRDTGAAGAAFTAD